MPNAEKDAPECDGCLCPTEHDGDYGSAGHAGPCPPHTCKVAKATREQLSDVLRDAARKSRVIWTSGHRAALINANAHPENQ